MSRTVVLPDESKLTAEVISMTFIGSELCVVVEFVHTVNGNGRGYRIQIPIPVEIKLRIHELVSSWLASQTHSED